jgi:RES domain-containing protein
MKLPALSMAKAKRGPSPTSPLIPVPPPNLHDLVTTSTWQKGVAIHRIHMNVYGSTTFNPGIIGNARFSPIKDNRGNSIPTIYGGTTFDCAAMETVFHDIPFTAGLKTFDKKLKLTGQVYSRIMPRRDLALADLSTTALRKLGIQRNQLIDTEKDAYSVTRAWAEAIHAQCPIVDGLCWVSRQDDRARACMLFGDRARESDLIQHGAVLDIDSNPDVYEDLLRLADRIGVKIT